MTRIDCAVHTGELAAWRCDDCKKALCPQCAAPGHMGLVRCGLCDGFARVLKLPAEVLPFLQTAKPFLRRLTEMDGLLSLVVLSIVMGLLSLGWVIGQSVAFGILTVYCLLLVRVSAEGEDALPDLSFDRLGGWSRALIRLLTAAAFLWGPFFFLLGLREGLIDVVFMGDLRPLWDPLMGPLTLVFLFLLPAAVMLSATVESLLPLINPMNVFRLIGLLRRDYLKAALVWILLVVIDRVWMALADGANELSPVPLLIPLLALPISLLPALLSAFLLGRVIFQHGETLGLLRWEDLAWEQVPGAQPLGVRPRFKQRAEDEPLIEIDLAAETGLFGDAPPPAASADDLALADAEASTGNEGVQGSEQYSENTLPVDDDVALELAFEPGSTIEDALDAGEDVLAIRRYVELQQTMPGGVSLPVDLDIRLAQAYERCGNHRGAALTWQRIAEADLKAPESARAVYQLARLLAGPLKRPAAAVKLCHRVRQEFPDSPAAAQCDELLQGMPLSSSAEPF